MTSPDSPAPRKRFSGVAIAVIGCAALLLIVAMVAALGLRHFAQKVKDTARETEAAKAEEVAVAERTGRDSSGIVVKGPDGEATIGGTTATSAPPPWVPAYPGAKAQSGGMKVEKSETIAGAFTAHTPDATRPVKEFFESRLKADGFEIEGMPAGTDSGDSAVVSARKEDGKRTITVLINRDQGTTTLVVNYEGPKP
jgi:hypothetical protein